ncbi:DDE-type integrase/transposase/recombinase [Cyanobium sp. Copco_Reservoir_LC18]|uniref:DDE-type integrase/transposase/recombinase n=1 Tax=Cyanobium sp. Copco_Reservoir_LC18 TaxID=1328305 RepID=UPI001F38F322
MSLAQLAAKHGISEQTARKWLARFRSSGPAALADRRSVRRSQRRTLDPQQLQQAVDLRHQRCTLRRIARLLLVLISTLGRAMRRLGLSRLRNLDPKPPVQRYQRERHGDMIHVDIKLLARFDRRGHRIIGDPSKGSSPGAGYEKVHLAVDDATRLSYDEVLADEKGPTTVSFLSRAVAWFTSHGIERRRVLSDNGSAYKSHGWRKAIQALGLNVKKTRPYSPPTNGKTERFIKTLLEEWAYVMPYGNSVAREELLPAYLLI